MAGVWKSFSRHTPIWRVLQHFHSPSKKKKLAKDIERVSERSVASWFVFLFANSEFHSHLASWWVVGEWLSAPLPMACPCKYHISANSIAFTSVPRIGAIGKFYSIQLETHTYLTGSSSWKGGWAAWVALCMFWVCAERGVQASSFLLELCAHLVWL
jgi:hypothetical protein